MTTVFDALVAGGAGNATRRALLPPAIETLTDLHGAELLRAAHFLHLRCDLVEREAAALVERYIDHALLRFVTFIDDQPDRDPARAAMVHEKRRGLPAGSLSPPIAPMPEEDFAKAEPARSHLVRECAARKIPTANHDDTLGRHVRAAAELGMRISEFPISLESATAAREAGLTVICGAPNLVRGKSHTGNVAVTELVRRDLVDILCSDYVPASLLQAVFQLGGPGFGLALPLAVAMASARPADLFGLPDRGRVKTGARADILRVRIWNGIPTLRQVWVGGREILGRPATRGA